MNIAPPAVAPVCGAQNLARVLGEGGPRPVVAINNMILAIETGSFTVIMGPSSSGESTLMCCITRPDRATSGSTWVGDQDLSRLSERQATKIRRDKIDFVFQSFNLLPTLTAEQSILLPLELAGRKPNREVFREIVDSLGLAERLTHHPNQLSEGQQQRVAIAQVLVTRPQVVFADEPTGALDSRTGTTLLQYLQRCPREQGQTIIMVTHDLKAAGYADRALMLSDESIVDDVTRSSAEIVLASLGRLGA